MLLTPNFLPARWKSATGRFTSLSFMTVAVALIALLTLLPHSVQAQVASLGDVSWLPILSTTQQPIQVNSNAGVAVDTHGNVYFPDYYLHKIHKVSPSGAMTDLNTGSFATNGANGMVFDSAGNLFIAESDQNLILKYDVNGVTTQVQLPNTTLNDPESLAFDAAGNLYIADAGSNRILKQKASDGTVSSISLAGDTPYYLAGIAVSPDGDTIYYSSASANYAIYNFVHKLTHVLSGQVQSAAVSMANLTPATVRGPKGLTLDPSGNLYIADSYNGRVLKVTSTGLASVVATGNAQVDVIQPLAVAVDSGGTVYFPDPSRDEIDRATLTSVNFGDVAVGATSLTRTLHFSVGANTTLGTPRVGTLGTPGADFALASTGTCTNGVTATASCTINITFHPSSPGQRSGTLQIVDSSNAVVSSVPLYGVGTSGLAVFPSGAATKVDLHTYVAGARSGVSADDQGNLYLADTVGNRILKVGSGATTLVSITGVTLSSPSRVVLDPSGNLLIADTGNNRVLLVNPSGAGTVISTGGLSLSGPKDLAVDAAGNVYIADTGNNRLVCIPIYGQPYVLLTAPVTIGQPTNIAVDSGGNIYFTQTSSNVLWKLASGSIPKPVSTSMTTSNPGGIAVDASGTVYLADTGNQRLLAIDTAGHTTIVSTGTLALTSPDTVATDRLGNLYVSDNAPNLVVRVARATPPSLPFATTAVGQTSSDSPQNVPLLNAGNTSLTLSSLSFPSNFPQGTATVNPCTSTLVLKTGASCDVAVAFQPSAAGAQSASVVISDNTLNSAGSSQSIGVTGAGSSLKSQAVSFALSPAVVTYGATPITLAATSTSGLAVQFSIVSGPATLQGSTLSITGAGSVVLAANQPGNTSYGPAPQVTRALTVNKSSLTLTAINATKLYGASLPSFSFSITGLVNGDTASVLNGSPVLSTTANTLSPVGSYELTMTAGTLSAANYNLSFVNGTLVVQKASLTVHATSATKIYGAALPALTYTLTGFVGGDTQASATTGVPALSTTAGVSSPAGNYPINAVAGTLTAANYTIAISAGTLTVGKASLLLTVANTSKAYGAPLPTFSCNVSGLVNGDIASVISGLPAYTTTATPASSVGSYPVSAAIGTLKATNYTISLAAGTLQVKPVGLVIASVNVQRLYGQANPAFTSSVTGLVNGDTQATALTGAPALNTTATASSNVGSYAITVNQGTLSAVNYTFTFQPGVLTVSGAVLTVTPDSLTRTYGASNPTLTYKVTGWVNGQGTSLLTGAPVITTSATLASPTAVYAITANIGTLAAINYVVKSGAGTLTVTPATLTLQVGNVSGTYGSAPKLTGVAYTVSGYKNGDTATVLTGTAAFSTTATAASPAGNYPLSYTYGSLTATNYYIHGVNGTYTVTKALLTIAAQNTGFTYGNANFPLLKVGFSGFVNSDTTNSALTGTWTISTTAKLNSPAGKYPITVAQNTLAAANYSFVFVPGILTVNPATLSITANDVGVEAGNTLLPFTYTVSGLVNSDSQATAFAGAPLLTSTGSSSSAVNSYPIRVSAGTLSSKNYVFAFTNGTLWINSPITLQLSKTTINFPNQAVGSTSASQIITVSNSSRGTFHVFSPQLGAPGLAGLTYRLNFSFSSTCGATLASGASCQLTVGYTPLQPGSLTAPVYLQGSSTPLLLLTGTSAYPTLAFSVGAASFSGTQEGLTLDQPVTATNSSIVPLTITSAAFSGPGSSSFHIKNNACPQIIGSGTSCTFTIEFAPKAVGALSATYVVHDNSLAGHDQIVVTGTGISPAPVPFVVAPIQQPREAEFSGITGIPTPAQTIYLENNGAAPLTSVVIQDADWADFPEVGNSCGPTLAAGAKCAVTIIFNPPVSQFGGSFQSHISFSFSGAGPTQSVKLFGDSVPPSPQIAVTIGKLPAPDTINLENFYSQPPTALTMTLTSAGNVPLKLDNIVLVQTQTNGKWPYALVLSPGCKSGSVMPIGSSCNFTILFKAYKYGTYDADLQINSNDISGVPVVIKLIGQGYNPTAP